MDHDFPSSVRRTGRRKKALLGLVMVLLTGVMGVYYTVSQRAGRLQSLQMPEFMSIVGPHEEQMKQHDKKASKVAALADESEKKVVAREKNSSKTGALDDGNFQKIEAGEKKDSQTAGLNDDSKRWLESKENDIDVQVDLHSTTTKAGPIYLDLLPQAAAAIKSSYIPPSYRFSNELYFHPPTSNQPLNLPRVLQHPFNACSQHSGQETFLVVLVLSSYLENGAREREAIRSTYGSVARGQQWPTKSMVAPVSLVFLLGRPPSGLDQVIIGQEIGEHGDLVVADFVDSYQNLTLKVLVGLNWALHHCSEAKFILKTDDDTFVNLPLLTRFLLDRGQNNSLYGTTYFASSVRRTGRWAVPKWAFPFPVFPVYLSGTGYVLSKDAAEKVLETSKNVPFIPIEDAYITGILAQIGKIRRMYSSGFTHFKEGTPDMCDFMLNKRLIGNRIPAAEKKSLWANLKINDRRFC